MTGAELDREVRGELRTLPKPLAEKVAGHLVMAGRLLDEEPATALAHAREARRLAPRVAAVREASGLVAYLNGEYSEALQDLRAVRRMAGSSAHLPVMADCERGLGRPDRALALARSEEARDLSRAAQVELLIVESGARSDMGQRDAAVLTLHGNPLRTGRGQPWWPRLAYAYADALLSAGRREEAHAWFARAADADEDEETDAAERLADLDGVAFLDGEADSQAGSHDGPGSHDEPDSEPDSDAPGAEPRPDVAPDPAPGRDVDR
ncbi:MAG: hypothetical protein ACRDYU_18790 [Actinomycetes bacterium]